MKIKQPDPRESPAPNLTSRQIDKLLAAAKSASRNRQRNFCLLLLIYRHGLTVTEACSLRLGDIDLERKRLYVRGSVHRLDREEIRAIEIWLAKRAQMKAPYTVKVLFISERRKHLARNAVNWIVDHTVEAAGLGHLSIHPHSLRRACAHMLASNGIDLREIQSHLRHRSISSTARCIGAY